MPLPVREAITEQEEEATMWAGVCALLRSPLSSLVLLQILSLLYLVSPQQFLSPPPDDDG